MKVYINTKIDDGDVPDRVEALDLYCLRLLVYGVARGNSFDVALQVAEYAYQVRHKEEE